MNKTNQTTRTQEPPSEANKRSLARDAAFEAWRQEGRRKARLDRTAMRKEFKKLAHGHSLSDIAGDVYLHNLYVASYWPEGKAVDNAVDFIKNC